MADPTVCAVMLTRDRPEMAARAVRCFRRQTYAAKRLCILDTGDRPTFEESNDFRIGVIHGNAETKALSIGGLRNLVADCCQPDIFIHWDDDDLSHPQRIAEQVSLLQSSGADCVGYREMLFWETSKAQSWMYAHSHPNYCLGTSLCYWRKAWEGCKFPPTSRGEDLAFVQRVRALGVSGVNGGPRMIATIHGSNTSESYDPRLMAAKEEWRRTPQWDDTVRKMLESA